MSSYVVTGAAKGIGVRLLCRARGKNLTVLQADVTDPKALQLAANEVSNATGGKLDYLINNAGKTNHPGFPLDGFPSPEAVEYDLLDNFKTNTIGVVHCTNAFIPLLKNGSTKKVLSVSSSIGDLELTLLGDVVAEPSYSISKAAINMVVAKYAAQYREEGFTFLAICPGMVRTSMVPTEDNAPGEMKMLAAALAKVAPDFKGPIAPEESVKMQLDVIYSWTPERSGEFVSHFGNKQWL
ncbi:hypothetical protein B0H14DRAFT_3088024 [Mycena olivaceomarginata]|nr:hypothetical protein B0H14DRAFT_3088024 [Mycena olivaceomarginata]